MKTSNHSQQPTNRSAGLQKAQLSTVSILPQGTQSALLRISELIWNFARWPGRDKSRLILGVGILLIMTADFQGKSIGNNGAAKRKCRTAYWFCNDYLRKRHAQRVIVTSVIGSNGVTVSTLDFESSDGGSNPPWSYYVESLVCDNCFEDPVSDNARPVAIAKPAIRSRVFVPELYSWPRSYV